MKSAGAGVAARAECHHCKPAPGSDSPSPAAPECCRAIQGGVVPDSAAAKPFNGLAQVPLVIFFDLVLPEPFRMDGLLSSLVHGPPRTDSFAETVLQRSLLSHAPPATV